MPLGGRVLAAAGEAAVALAFLAMAAAAACLALGSWRGSPHGLRWGRRLVWLAFAGATVAVALLVTALVGDRFELAYVARNGQRAMPLAYKVAALWSGQAGSLLLWFWLLAAFTAATAWGPPPGLEDVWPRALAVLAGSAAFFGFLVAAVEPPFALQVPAPPDGRGMNPLLRHPSMLVHPLLLYSGFIAFSVPFAFAVGALLQRRADARWFAHVRRWALAAWLLLSMGILAGAHWAYEVLGWGGYWGWDPVENAALVPWLTATAFLHSAMVQERRGMLRRWNLGLVMATYVLTILGTFLTRSGVLVSVHAFAQSDIGPWFVAYLGLAAAGSAYLLADRWPLLADEGAVESPLSREAGFLLNNWLFTGSAFTVLWGILFPLLMRAFGFPVALGAPYYERIQGPLFLVVLLLMGVGPLLAWRRTSPQAVLRRLVPPVLAALHAGVTAALLDDLRWGAVFGMAAAGFTLVATLVAMVRGPGSRPAGPRVWSLIRWTGGYVVHAGIALIAIGVVGSQFYAVERDLTLVLGERARVGPYVLEYSGLSLRSAPGYAVVAADVRVWSDGDAQPDFVMRPQKLLFPPGGTSLGPVTRVAVAGSLLRDLYVALAGWEEDGSRVALHVRVNPLVAWIWIGGYLMLAGALLALWPGGAVRAGATVGAQLAGAGSPPAAPAPAAVPAMVRAAGGTRGPWRALRGWLGTLLAGGLVLLAPAAARAAPALAVESEVLVLQLTRDGTELLTIATLANLGDEPAVPVALPLPQGAVAVMPRGGFTPGRVEVSGTRLLDAEGLPPRARRTYAYVVLLPFGEPPFLVEREVLYPTRAQTVLLDPRLRPAGRIYQEEGTRELGGVALRAYARGEMGPGQSWRLAVQAADPAAGLPVVVQQERVRGWAVPAVVTVLALLGGGLGSWARAARGRGTGCGGHRADVTGEGGEEASGGEVGG